MYRLSVLLILCVQSFAQSQSATLNGRVNDSTGAAVPSVHVRLTNTNTGENWSVVGNDSGNYIIPLVKPGAYTLTAERPGFKISQQTGLVLETGAQVRVDITLEVGALTERIEVRATAPLLQSETSVVGAVIENHTIVNMPLINRRAAQLARLTGFVVQNGTGSNFTMAGGRGDNSMWLIDGANAQNVLLGVQTLTFDPPIESLQEFNVSVSNYSAELGRTGGGVVQMTTKSGTNQFHGSAYEYLRNDKLDARTFFAASRAKLRYNLFGASLGGPIKRDKTHFFFNYEGRRTNDEVTFIQNVPTPAETRGDFSGNPRLIIRDPEAAGRPPFAGNIIPASRLDPIGTQLAAFYPTPNVPGRGSGDANFRANQSRSNPVNTYVARIDHVFSDRDRMYGRFLANLGNNLEDPIWPTPGTDPVNRKRYNTYYNASGSWFHNFTPGIANEFRFGYDRRTFINRTGGAHTGLNGKLKIKGVDPDFFPLVTLTGLASLGNNSNQERLQLPIRTNHFVNHVLVIRGNHSIKFGGEFRFGRNDDLNRNRPGGQFGFNDVAMGSSLAALLLGWPQSARIDAAVLIRSRADTFGAFFQDDWKIAPRLTLNLGLRWDLDTPRHEAIDNRQNSFDRAAINPVCNCPGLVIWSGRNGVSRYAHNFDVNNFGPRVGLAWRVANDWVVRAGAAVVYTGEYDQATPLVSNLGFSVQGDFVSPDNGLTPALRLRDGIPSISLPAESDLVPGFGAVAIGQRVRTSVEFFEPSGRATGYLTTLNFNIERQLPGQALLELGYLSTLGHKLPAPASLTQNQVRPELMGPGNAQTRRPFPQFSDVAVLAPAIGNSNYHGMNIKIEKRYSRGLQFQANYTWAKSIDDVESRNELGGGAGNAYSNVYNRRADRGLSGNSIAHRLIWSSVYELPLGRGRAWAISNPVLDRIAGGWTLGYIAEFRTGAPYGVLEQTNRTNAFAPSQRPNVVGVATISEDRSRAEQVRQWFNTAAFAQPDQFTFGNAGRINGFGPGAVAMDLSVLKDFTLTERARLQFRAEALNFINKPNFGLPNLNRGNNAFGRITGLAPGNASRIIQFGLHLKF